MKLKVLSFFLVTILFQSVVAQIDTLNRYDKNNKKTGWWIVYLDSDLAVIEDSTKAVYYRYSYFDGKFDYFNMGRIGTKKNPVIAPSGEKVKELKLLNGEYRANHSNGQTRFVLSASKGKLIYYKEYYSNGVLKTHFDYTQSCGDTPFHYCIYQYNKDGSLKNKSTIQTP